MSLGRSPAASCVQHVAIDAPVRSGAKLSLVTPVSRIWKVPETLRLSISPSTAHNKSINVAIGGDFRPPLPRSSPSSTKPVGRGAGHPRGIPPQSFIPS
ncbi:hypothetical protein LMH87_000714 [Akanthomyces muscarius]|uniref:Uncharacterized protein n=1 Tax=Akanthomyces muscarius TaxID=2231603 RepID=A0A9W8QIG7_AKAMU|nr:hypothetical protein LMH87_000714 [Akanthomyces muscarius]KAJ4155473.1 hypothetical protein LMH87_000714 [Akanthomyces muscarius]